MVNVSSDEICEKPQCLLILGLSLGTESFWGGRRTVDNAQP